MPRSGILCLAAMAGCTLLAPMGRAEVIVREPGVVVRVGQPANVVAPVVTTTYQSDPKAPPPPPPGEGVPVPPPPSGPAVKALTLEEFAAGFKPAPGDYEVYLIHPSTCCPVKVCFTLPCGCVKKVCVTKREIVFKYCDHEQVKIRMAICGKVRVVNR